MLQYRYCSGQLIYHCCLWNWISHWSKIIFDCISMNSTRYNFHKCWQWIELRKETNIAGYITAMNSPFWLPSTLPYTAIHYSPLPSLFFSKFYFITSTNILQALIIISLNFSSQISSITALKKCEVHWVPSYHLTSHGSLLHISMQVTRPSSETNRSLNQSFKPRIEVANFNSLFCT